MRAPAWLLVVSCYVVASALRGGPLPVVAEPATGGFGAEAPQAPPSGRTPPLLPDSGRRDRARAHGTPHVPAPAPPLHAAGGAGGADGGGADGGGADGGGATGGGGDARANAHAHRDAPSSSSSDATSIGAVDGQQPQHQHQHQQRRHEQEQRHRDPLDEDPDPNKAASHAPPPEMASDDLSSRNRTGAAADAIAAFMKLAAARRLEAFMNKAEEMYTDNASDQQVAALKLFRILALLGHSGAMTTVGTILAAGDTSISRDLAKGVQFLRLAADKGQPDALAFFGFLHASGIADRFGVERNEGKALLYLKLAAGTGSIVADMSLGYRHLRGVGVAKSCALASGYYGEAARAIASDSRYMPTLENFMRGSPPIPAGLKIEDRGRLTDESFEDELAGASPDTELVEYYRLLASQGDAGHLTTIGGLQLFGGNGLEPDENRARADLERAARMGHGQAHGMLAHLALNRRDNATALSHFRRAAAAADGTGFYGLGMMYLHGVGLVQDYAEAAKYFKLAVDSAHADSAYQLGVMYWQGTGVEENKAEGYRLFHVGARLGHMQSKMNVGLILIEGQEPVKEPDCQLGVQYLKAVAESGEWKSLLNLALDQLEKGDIFGALYRYMQAAYAGIEVAQYNAALLLEKGAAEELGSFIAPWGATSLHESEELQHWGAERMLSVAFELYEMSAGQGHSASLLRMGDVAYSEANDYRTAAVAYQKSAEMRNAEATFSLGWMYLRGLGVSSDRAMAVRYLEMSKRFSHEAVVPATIALFAAQAVWCLADTMRWFGLKSGDPATSLRLQAGPPQGSNWKLQWDVIVIIELLGLMAAILFVRRRRMEQHVET